MPLILLGGLVFMVFVFSTAMDFHYNNEEVLQIIGISFGLILIGVLVQDAKRYENAKIQFLPEGVIMKSIDGFIPIKYGAIKRIPLSDFSVDRAKSYFYLHVEDARKYEIKIDSEIYDALLEILPLSNKS